MRAAWLAPALALLMAPRGAGYAIVATPAIDATTIAEIFIEEDRIRVEAEIGAGDGELWRELRIAAGAGAPLAARLLERAERPKFRRDEVTGEALLPEEGAAEMITWAVFEYPLRSRPARLRFAGPRIGFVVYHQGLPVIDLHYLEGEAELALDWREPWNSRFTGARLRRQYDARASVFLYVEPYEVRTEVVLRPVDLVPWHARTIPPEAQEELKQRVAAELAASAELLIDGRPQALRLDRIHFIRRRLWTSTVIEPPEELAAASATLGAVFITPTGGYPREVTLAWKRFSAALPRLAAAVSDETGPRPAMLQPGRNVLRWENLGRLSAPPPQVAVGKPPSRLAALWPVAGFLLLAAMAATAARALYRFGRTGRVSRPALALSFLLLAAAGGAFTAARSARVDSDRAGAILQALLFNIYRAFDYRDEETVYDLLAASVSGDLLRRIYLEARAALELRNQGGARAKVRAVEIVRLEAKPLSREAGFRARALWNVTASVGHWGHIHQRLNRYEATLTVRAVEGTWKITGIDIAAQERLR